MSKEQIERIEQLQQSIRETQETIKFCQQNERNAARVSYLERGNRLMRYDVVSINHPKRIDHPKGYEAILQAFTIKHEHETRVRNEKLRTALKDTSDLVDSLEEQRKRLGPEVYAKTMVKKLTDQEGKLADAEDESTFNSVAIFFFSRNRFPNVGHFMTAQLRQYKSGQFSVVLFNHACLLKPRMDLVMESSDYHEESGLPDVVWDKFPIVTEYFVPKESLEEFVKLSRVPYSQAAMPEIIKLLENNKTFKREKRGPSQTHANCPARSIGVLINDIFGSYNDFYNQENHSYTRHGYDEILEKGLSSFVKNYDTKTAISELAGIEKEQQKELAGLLQQIPTAPNSGKLPSVRTAPVKAIQLAKHQILAKYIEADNEQQVLEIEKENPALIRVYKELLLAQKEVPIPKEPYQGIGVSATVVKENGMVRVNIDEVYSPNFARFSKKSSSGELEALENQSDLKGKSIVSISIIEDGKIKEVSVDEIFKGDPNDSEGLKNLASIFHGQGDILFKTVDKLGVVEEYSCLRNNKSVFVTQNCETVKENLVQQSLKGEQYDPRRHRIKALDDLMEISSKSASR